MVSYTSAAAQIASAIKATLDTFSITRVDQLPTIQSIKQLKLELCNMTAAINSAKTGGKFGHMYVILTEDGGGIPPSNEQQNGHGRHAIKAP